MIKISELATSPSVFRMKYWLETLKLPIDWSNLTDDVLKNPTSVLKNSELQGILISPSFSNDLISASSKKPTEVVEVGMADSLVRAQGTLWLRCFLRQALKQSILENAPQLDTHAFVYITGSDALARLSAVVAVQLGFRRLVILSQNQAEATETFNKLQRLFFDLEIKILAETELTLQPNNGSLLLNTLDFENENEAFEELLYLNFLRKDGLVVNLYYSDKSSSTNALIDEARNVNVRLITAEEVWGLRDFFFLQALLSSEFTISKAQYLQDWIQLFTPEKQT